MLISDYVLEDLQEVKWKERLMPEGRDFGITYDFDLRRRKGDTTLRTSERGEILTRAIGQRAGPRKSDLQKELRPISWSSSQPL